MGELVKRRATYADLLALPDNMVGEILNGELVASPRPSFRHGSAATTLGAILVGAFQFGNGGPGGWRIVIEPELHLGPDVVVPDLAGWRKERMPTLPDTAAIELAPDWVCEVLSPSTARYDRGPKRRIYAGASVPYSWIVDRSSLMIEAYRLVDGAWSDIDVYAGNVRARIPPFDTIEIDLALLWTET